MTKANITQYDSTPSNNADINDINIAENCPASNINNAIRELMAHLKNVDTGSQALTALSVTGAITGTTATLTTADNNPQLTLTSTDADANAGAEAVLDRNSSSPADDDRIGKLTFKGRNDANQVVEYGNIQQRITDASDGTEDGRIIIQNIMAGDVAGVMESNGTETIFNNNSKDLDFRVESNGNANMIFVDGGNDKVGIGNNNPNDFGSLASDLVIGTTSGEHGLTIATGTANSARIQFADNTSSPFVGAIEYSHGNNFLYFYTSGTQQLKITNNGFVQSPPTASNTVSSSANMFITSGGEFAKSTSSRRFKNTINDATHGLTELLQLRSVTYKGNNDGDIVFGGLIAEEVHDVGLTEFVQYDDEDRPESLHYTHMVALCVKAIQELSAKVTTLETENTTQATQIADLISRVTALENA